MHSKIYINVLQTFILFVIVSAPFTHAKEAFNPIINLGTHERP